MYKLNKDEALANIRIFNNCRSFWCWNGDDLGGGKSLSGFCSFTTKKYKNKIPRFKT